jgi:hypothetical protein
MDFSTLKSWQEISETAAILSMEKKLRWCYALNQDV